MSYAPRNQSDKPWAGLSRVELPGVISAVPRDDSVCFNARLSSTGVLSLYSALGAVFVSSATISWFSPGPIRSSRCGLNTIRAP